MSGSEGAVLRSLMREERALAVILDWAYLRLRSSMSTCSFSIENSSCILRGVSTRSNESPFWPLSTS